MAETKSAMRKPVFTKVDQLRPGTNGHNLVVKVVSSKVVLRKGRPDGPQVHQMRIAECLVEMRLEQFCLLQGMSKSLMRSGPHCEKFRFIINLRPLAFQFVVDLMKPDSTVTLRNAKIDMFKGSMRLAVDKWGRVEVAEPAKFTVKEDNNLSLVEYELVNVVEE
ncbi:hypothetical protein Sango_0065100 [Sesamum angolense]|uniref:Single-stranded DNA binding protein Ssb-like OB fold domain-containing protein n=1 Tax=Sesamum angolense TaxID=2727404 RepID=A0AAE1XEG6_9LAMI|nr:hypothetical protein Sango_0065100 [Sesamum angolense]